MPRNIIKSVFLGILASVILLGVYFATLTLISGWGFAQNQFADFWYFIVSLAVGFGIQVGLYVYLRDVIRGGEGGGKVLGVTGTASTAAMISCCTHYLANVLPILGIAGAFSIIVQYQTEVFWIGLLFNMFGIAFISGRIIKFRKQLWEKQRS